MHDYDVIHLPIYPGTDLEIRTCSWSFLPFREAEMAPCIANSTVADDLTL